MLKERVFLNRLLCHKAFRHDEDRDSMLRTNAGAAVCFLPSLVGCDFDLGALERLYCGKRLCGNNGMNSFNHYAAGAVGQWMVNHQLGVSSDEDVPGFKHFILQPSYGGTITFTKGYYDSVYGRIISEWKLDGGNFIYNVTVPANTTATLYLPAASHSTVMESGKLASKAEGVTFVGHENGRAVYELESGSYRFTVQGLL